MSGKTILVLGIIYGLIKRGYKLSPLKWARLYRHFLSPGLGRQTSRNLDVALTEISRDYKRRNMFFLWEMVIAVNLTRFTKSG
jgi:cobyrinic acid a,c-diamide synthase